MSAPVLLNDPESRRRHRRTFILILVSLLLLAFLYVIAPILMGLVAGLLLWVVTRPMYERLLRKTNRPGLAATLSILGTLLLVILPITVLVVLMAADASTLGQQAKGMIEPIQPQIDESIERITHGRSLYVFGFEIQAQEIRQRAAMLTAQIGQFLIDLVQKTASGILQFGVGLFVALYTLYFFYHDGDRYIEWLQSILPMEPQHSARLIQSFFDTSIATLKMLGVIGVVQGAACGLAFWILGAPAVIFLSVAAMISTVIPSFGPGLVIIPVAIGFLLAGMVWQAIVLLAWGAVVVGNLDNILRPYLVHKAIAMNQLVIFITMLGGIASFGFFGVLIGPVIAALLKASLDVYRDVFRGGEPEPNIQSPVTGEQVSA